MTIGATTNTLRMVWSGSVLHFERHQIRGIGAMPILQFSTQNPLRVSKSALRNPTGLRARYDASSSVGRLSRPKVEQFRRCGLNVMRKKIVRLGAAASVRTKKAEGPEAKWVASSTSAGNGN